MGMWTRSLVVVYRVYHGPTKMEGNTTCRASRTRELDTDGQREIMTGLCSRAAKGGDGVSELSRR
jgi:hypothetical protein